MLNKKKLSVAVAIAVGSVAVVGSAQGGQLLFPYSAVSDSVTTIFSVINTQGNKPGKAGEDVLHYRYYYKVMPPLTGDAEADEDAWNALHCEETNYYLPTSKFDIQTIDIAGTLSGGVDGVLFNDPSNNNKWAGNDYAMARFVEKPHRGYLHVEHAAGFPGADESTEGLYGEAIVFEFGSGAAWGYQGFHKAGLEATSQCDYTPVASDSPNHVHIFPLEDAAFTTKFLVTPLYDMDGAPDACPDDKNENMARIELEAADSFGFNVAMFDRDENPVSGATPKDVVCVGAVSAKNLINDGSQARVDDGGWTGVNNIARVANNGFPPIVDGLEPGAILFKLEYGATDAINPGTPGVYNNGMYLHPEAWPGDADD